VSDRVYRRGLPARQALRELYNGRGSAFDGRAVEALIKLVGVYPVGTRVQLNSGERGTVIAPNPDDSTHPIVRIEQDRHGRSIPAPYAVTLRSGASEIARALS
jgi:HD-GYP domain-containing protein (c-di-GMP phosphodiesterase class II)